MKRRKVFMRNSGPLANKPELELREQQGELPFPGRPGFRTRVVCSGLDPMDTYLEWGYVLGLFCRNLFTGRLRTRNRLYLALMAIVGLGAFMPIICAVVQLISSGRALGGLMLCTTPLAFFGFALLVNLAINLKNVL